jgi:hypothetical protein
LFSGDSKLERSFSLLPRVFTGLQESNLGFWIDPQREKERESKRDSSDSFSFVDDNDAVGPTTGLVLSLQRQHHQRGLESEELVQEMRVAVQARICT